MSGHRTAGQHRQQRARPSRRARGRSRRTRSLCWRRCCARPEAAALAGLRPRRRAQTRARREARPATGDHASLRSRACRRAPWRIASPEAAISARTACTQGGASGALWPAEMAGPVWVVNIKASVGISPLPGPSYTRTYIQAWAWIYRYVRRGRTDTTRVDDKNLEDHRREAETDAKCTAFCPFRTLILERLWGLVHTCT